MADSPYTGLTAKVSIKSGAGTETDLCYVSGCDLTLEKDIIEVIQFGAKFKEKVPSIHNWSASIDGTVALAKSNSQDTLFEAFNSDAILTVTMYLNATTKFSGDAYVKNFNISMAADDKISLTSDLEGTGAVTLTYPAG